MRRLSLFGLSTALLCAGCATHGLNLVQDHRLNIVRPQSRATLHLPFTIHWRSTNAAAASYMVFLDRSPMPVGRTIDSFPATDPLNGVYPRRGQPPLHDDSLRIATLPPRGSVARDQRDRHEITVVWLDDKGRRLTETSAFVDITIKGPSS